MGMTKKKNIYNSSNLSKLKENDALSRMNFLFQASNFIKNKSKFLSHVYLNEMNQISEKRVIRKLNLII